MPPYVCFTPLSSEWRTSYASQGFPYESDKVDLPKVPALHDATPCLLCSILVDITSSGTFKNGPTPKFFTALSRVYHANRLDAINELNSLGTPHGAVYEIIVESTVAINVHVSKSSHFYFKQGSWCRGLIHASGVWYNSAEVPEIHRVIMRYVHSKAAIK